MQRAVHETNQFVLSLYQDVHLTLVIVTVRNFLRELLVLPRSILFDSNILI